MTVDNGVSSVAGVEAARNLGIPVLVTDHHLPGAVLPRAEVIVNPNLADCRFASPALAGVGVAFYVVAALARALAPEEFRAAMGVERARRSLEQPRLPNKSTGVPVDVEERLLDRLDPAGQLDRLARFLWRRKQLSVLRGEFMYFYTELESGRGLAGVNLNNGRTGRAIKLTDPDYRLTTDEAAGRLFVAKGIDGHVEQ